MPLNYIMDLSTGFIMQMFTFFFIVTFPASESAGRDTGVAVATTRVALNQSHTVAICMYAVLELKHRLTDQEKQNKESYYR